MSDRWTRELEDPRRAHAPEPEYVPYGRPRRRIVWRRLLPTILVLVALGLALTAALHHRRVYRPLPTRTVTVNAAPVHHHRARCPQGEVSCAAQRSAR